MSINFQLIGQRVRAYRCRRNLNQQGLAWDAQLSVPYLSRIENGEKQASLGSIIKIAAALGVTVDSLVFGTITYSEEYDFRTLSALLSDCSDVERRIIMDVALETAAAIKRSLRDNNAME